MGRDKRIAESRAKEILDKDRPVERKPAQAASAPIAAAQAIPAAEHTGTAKALLQILMLYAGPVILMLLVGKFLLHL